MFTVTENDKSFIIVIKILGIENSFSKLNLVAYCCNVLISPQSTALKKKKYYNDKFTFMSNVSIPVYSF
jgi:hypothetical protein